MFSINPQAPAVTRQERHVDLPVERVFALLADVADWPRWQPAVKRAAVRGGGPLTPGATIDWSASGANIQSTVELLAAPHRIGWRGRALGTRALHVWELEAQGSGTLVRTEESMEGWLPRIAAPLVRRMLERGVRETLDALAQER